MDKDKSFRTKTGYCHVLPEKILFTKNGDIENVLSNKTENKDPALFKVIFAILFLALLYLAYTQYKKEVITLTTFIILIILLPVIAFLFSASLKPNTVNCINRDKIKRVKLYKGLGGMTYSKLFIYYEAENGRQLVKDISLQDPILSGKKGMEHVLKILSDENLIDLKK